MQGPGASLPWWHRVVRRLGGDADPAEDAAFELENRARNLRRVRILAPLMILLHVAHIAFYATVGDAATAPDVARWHAHVVAVHAATLPLGLLVVAVAYLLPGSLAGRHLVPAAALLYLLHGAFATGVDQIAFSNVAAFTGFALGIAVICGFALRTCVWIYGVAFAALVALLFEFQLDPAARQSNVLNALTVVLMSVALNVLLHAARRRDFGQRRIIARQRDELASLNSDLERRVDEQVAEIVRRAREVDQLNAQLRSQIRARSTELQEALAQLSARRDEERLLPPGALLGDRFEIDGRLGAGGMGVVYSGTDRATGERIAIKVIRPDGQLGVDAMRRFLGEAGVVATLDHPAVVRMIHVDVSADGLLFQAQELVDGLTLERALDDGPWPAGEAARLGAALAEALAAAHSRGVIHRDVKPANVMLTSSAPGLKLLDFGLARLYDGAWSGERERTGSRLIVGTPAYMAPEQVVAGDVSDKADVYALGMLLFQVLAGRLAFEETAPSGVMMQHVSSQAPDVRTLVAEAGEDLPALVAACLDKDPAARPTSADVALVLAGVAERGGAAPLDAIVRTRFLAAKATRAPTTSGSIARRLRGLSGAFLA